MYPCICVSGFCSDDISRTAQSFLSNLVWWCVIMSWNVMVCYLQSHKKVTKRRLISSKYDYSHYIFWTSDPFATRLGLLVSHRKLECPLKNWITVFKVKVTAKDQNVSEWLCRYLLIHHTFCYQTWHDDASLWARVSYRKMASLPSRPRSEQGLIWSKQDCFYYIFLTRLLFSRSRSVSYTHLTLPTRRTV